MEVLVVEERGVVRFWSWFASGFHSVLPIHSLHCLFNAVFVLVMANSLPHVVRPLATL